MDLGRYVVKRSRRETIGGLVFMSLFVGYLVWFGVVPKFRATGSDGAVITLDVAFDAPAAGSQINQRLAGDLAVGELLQDVAVCRNGPDWLADITLNNEVVVATLPELVRAAELGADGEYQWGMIREAEQKLWNGVNPPDLARLLAEDGWDEVDVARYMKDRVEAPSPESQVRFVAYAAARDSLGDGILRVVDSSALDGDAVLGFAGRAGFPHVHVAGADADPRPVEPSKCRDVLAQVAER